MGTAYGSILMWSVRYGTRMHDPPFLRTARLDRREVLFTRKSRMAGGAMDGAPGTALTPMEKRP